MSRPQYVKLCHGCCVLYFGLIRILIDSGFANFLDPEFSCCIGTGKSHGSHNDFYIDG